MSKNQVETYLSFKNSNKTKIICKLIVTNKWDIFLSLPKILSDAEPTFLEKSTFLSTAYNYSWINQRPLNELQFKDISSTVNKFKLSYHPDWFVQFSGTGKIISWKYDDGKPKGFWLNSFSIDNICSGPFLGMNFCGNLWLFEDKKEGSKTTNIPIFKRWKTNTYITSVSNETNIALELFIRKIRESDPRMCWFISEDINSKDDLIGVFPHPNERLFKLRIFIFEYNSKVYLLWARLLIREKLENDMKKWLRYSISTATEQSEDAEIRYRIWCYHGKYWQDFFQSKINKNIDL